MPEQQIFLDESNENAPPDGFTIVETEIDFLELDGNDRLWIRGQVCDYARAVYHSRNLKVTELRSPRSRLSSLMGDVADRIDTVILKRSLEILDSNAKPKTLAELLFSLTHDEFWVQSASIDHAARFLTIEVDENLYELGERQKQIWLSENQKSNLKKIYQNSFDQRENFLQKWLIDERTRRDLGEFPLLLSEKHARFLSDEIGRQLRSSEGKAVSDFPASSINKEIYAKSIVEYFSVNTTLLSADIIAQVSSLLSPSQRAQLEQLLPRSEISLLAIDADFQSALNWATEKYLPFRAAHWNVENCAEADRFAESFADWMLENYPKLTNLDRETSPINLRTFYTIQTLLEKGYWVLWTVVDGLSWENHQRLLQMLGGKSANLRIAENSPVFAVLPTITSRAKFGLTCGKFPAENSKLDWNHKKNFLSEFPKGVYAGSTGMGKISEGLKQEKPTVCYWNYLKIDECYHDETDSVSIRHEVEAQLQSLAAKINHLVESAREKNRVAVVICSDHGQMVNDCRKIEIKSDDIDSAHGRTALSKKGHIFRSSDLDFVKNVNNESVELNPTSFRLSEPTTIALGSTYFVDLKATEQQGAIGVHGGLFPEEAVVGLAVLMRQPTHKKLTVTAAGNGESGKPGVIKLTVDNPNLAPVNPLSVTIENLIIRKQGDLLLAKIPALNKWKFELPVENFPAPSSGEEYVLKGTLHYEYDDGTKEECSVIGTLNCKSLYTAKNPSLLDRFKK